jgi:hypothetical protein
VQFEQKYRSLPVLFLPACPASLERRSPSCALAHHPAFPRMNSAKKMEEPQLLHPCVHSCFKHSKAPALLRQLPATFPGNTYIVLIFDPHQLTVQQYSS